MNDSVKLEIVVDDQGSLVVKNFKETVGKAFGDLPKETGKANDALAMTWKQMAKGVIAGAGLSFGLQTIGKELRGTITEATAADKTNRQLESSLRANGESAQVLGGIYDEWASQMQAMTGYTGGEIKSLITLGNHLNVHREQMRGVVEGAIGLTTIYGGPMLGNLEAVAKAYQGQWAQAEKMIPQLKDITNESDKLALLQKKMAEGFTAATDAMKGQAGELINIKNQWNDTKEAAGRALLTIFGGLKSFSDHLTGHSALLRRMKAEQDAYNDAMVRAAATRATYAGIIADEAIKELEAEEILSSVARIRKEIAEIIRKDKAEAVANAQAEALRKLQDEERKATEFREQYGSVTEGLTRAGRELLFQTMQLTGFLPEFNAETQRAAEEQEALDERMRGLVDAEGQLTAAGEGVLIGMYQWAGLLPTVTTGTNQSSEATKKWTINWKDANEVMQFAQSMVAGITDLLGAMGIELGASGEAALQAASGIGQLWAGISSGNPMQIISGVTQALTGLVKLFSGDGVGEAIARENEWMDLTKQQTEQIRELERQYGSTHAATSELLDQFISSADITSSSFDQWAERMRGILSDLDQGKMSLAQTQAELGDAFTALISKAQELGTEGSASLISFYEDLANRGIQVAEVQEYINSKLEAGADFYADLKDMIDSSSVAQQVFGNISVPIFDEILAYRQKLAENDDLVKSIGAATNMMVSLTDATRIEQAQFDQFALSGIRSFDALIAGGMNSSQALQAMAPYLQRLQFLHEQYGFTIDENTQRILDQAKQEGVVFENKKTEQQQVIDLLSIIARQLGADIPGALDTTAQAASEAFTTATREAGKFDEALDEIGKTRTITIGTKKGKGNVIEAATGFHGWVAPRSYTEFVTGEDEAEYVSITPQSDLNRAAAAPAVWTPQAGGQTLIIEDHSVLNVHVDPKSGIDQNALADGIRLVIEDNRNLVTDKIAKAVQRRI